MTITDLTTQRLDLAGTRAFSAPGAGGPRRETLTTFGRDWLQDIWSRATQGSRVEGVALAAVGSFARREAGPLSDFDLVLLHYGRSLTTTEVTQLADRLWYPVWDAGARLDHSVRTVTQCRSVASGDLAAAVGLLDLTWVAGDQEVVTATRATLAHDWRGNARKRLPQLIESIEERHARHGDLAQTLEPDLKESRGGLRDMTVLRALTAAWLADRPHGDTDGAYAHLLDVRDAVHVVTGRGRDRLAKEDHDSVAALLGQPYSDTLLTGVVTSARTIAYALDGTVRRAAQSQRARTLRVGPRRPQLTPLGYGLFEHDGEIVLGGSADPSADPLLVLRAALVSARQNLPLSPATITNLARSAPLPTPWPPVALGLFGDLLAAGPGLLPVWEGLDLAGVVESWIPEWADVRSRPQRNPVHRHTVDRHLIETVVRATGLVRDVDRPDLLLLGALLHDIGKVAGAHDHSAVGAPIAARILTRMGLPPQEVAVVQTLVREHLTLIDLATRRDPTDPQTLVALMAAVGGSLELRELLRALTEADASAVGPAAWTDWRAQLLARLVDGARATMGEDHQPAAPPRESPEVVTGDIVASVVAGEPHVVVRTLSGAHRVDVFDRDRLGLFADTAGLLAASGLVVRTAILRTYEGIAADQWQVESPGGDAPDAVALARSLRRLADGDRSPLQSLERRRAPSRTASALAASGSPGQTRAMVVPHASDDATVIEVRAVDRVGLLHEIGMTFARAGLSVRSAHIATYAGQTLDTFYVTEFGGRSLPPARVAQAVSMLIDACDGVLSRGR